MGGRSVGCYRSSCDGATGEQWEWEVVAEERETGLEAASAGGAEHLK